MCCMDEHALNVATRIVPPLLIVLSADPDVVRRSFEPLYAFTMLRRIFYADILQCGARIQYKYEIVAENIIRAISINAIEFQQWSSESFFSIAQ